MIWYGWFIELMVLEDIIVFLKTYSALISYFSMSSSISIIIILKVIIRLFLYISIYKLFYQLLL
jgi:hypothetical protein